MIFRQIFDLKSSTYTYLLADEQSKEAVIIDPVLEQVTRDLALAHELGVTIKYTLDTHCHADHVTGSWLIKQKTNAQIGCAKTIKASNTDLKLEHGDIITFGSNQLQVKATPGHTNGCLTFIHHAQKIAFTGDALLIRGCGRCDFQQGSAAQLYDSIMQQIFSLPDDYVLYPGHDYAGRCSTSVLEEKKYNMRLGGDASKQDFVGYMDNMTLAHPKYIDVALPANLHCGQVSNMPQEPDWAPVELTYAGIYEVTPIWAANHLDEVTLIDVREPNETNVSRIKSSLLLPLNELKAHLKSIPTDKPILTFCHSGRRSALAVNILNQAGIEDVANINGGIIRWQEQGLPLQGAK